MPRLLLRWLPLWLGVLGTAAAVLHTSVHCHVQQTAFLLGTDYLWPYLRYPGGLAEYLALPLALIGSSDWGGAVVLTVLAACYTFVGAALLRPTDRTRAGALLLLHVPAVLIVGLMLDFLFPLAVLVRLLLAGLALVLVERLGGAPWTRRVGAALAALTLYYAAGGAAAWIWTAAFWASQVGRQRGTRSWTSALAATIALVAAVGAGHRWIFLVDWHDAAWLLVPRLPHFLAYEPGLELYLLCAWLPLAALTGRLAWRSRAVTTAAAADAPAPAGRPPGPRFRGPRTVVNWLRRRPRWVRPTLEYLLLAGAAAGLVLPRLDSLPRHRAQADYCAAQGQWNKVIDIVRRTGTFDPVLSALWARALAHTGGLGTSLFAYPQILGTDGVFPGKYVTGETALPSCDLWYDLGYVAAAQRWACEAQTLQPFAPRVLERLAATSLIQEDWRLADTYLRVLARNPWYRTRASAQQALLADPARAAADSLMAAKRRQMPLGGIISNDPGRCLETLLAHDPTNRMAYEYLLTYHLLKHEFGDFVARLADWPRFGYGELPRTFQEGLLTAYAAQTPGAAALLGRSPVAPAVLQGFTEFGRVLAHYHGSREQARDELLARFAGTYWCYVNYQSPLVTKVQLRAREVD